MAPKHHPGAQVLADFLMGDCSPGTALLVARHVGLCPQCRRDLQQMGAEGIAANTSERGDWRQFAEGVDFAPLRGVSGLGEAVYEIRAEASARFPLDGSIRMAEMLVLAGALLIGREPYGPGDFLTAPKTAGAIAMVTAQNDFSALLTSAQDDDLDEALG